jgi:hypothetical protein
MKFKRSQGTNVRKISSYKNKKQQTHRTSHSSATQNTNKKPFRMLNHHYRMKMALIKTKLRNKPSSSNQQQPTVIRIQGNRIRRKSQKKEMRNKNRNSPHSNWSLHNRPPRKIRNIIPETPAQNVPALPQNSSPLVRQHRSHSCNMKPQSQIQAQTPNWK